MFKLVSKDGDFLPLLKRIEDEGYPVKAYLDGSNKMYDNMIDKVDNPLELDIAFDDVVIFDMVGAGEAAEVLKEKNYTVIGGGKLNDEIELDRSEGFKLMVEGGIKIPPGASFDSFEEAAAFVQKTGKRYVFKPDGNKNTSLTYVSHSAEELLAMFPYLKEECGEGATFELQEFVEGVEMSTEAWFNGKNFLMPINSTFEEKPLMNEGLGPATGCAGNVVWCWDKERSEKIYHLIFEPLEDKLREANYLGPLDLNAIWTEEGPFGLEWTSRFGYDAIQSFSRLITEDLGSFFRDLPNLTKLPVSEGFSVAVRVSIPPYPSDGKPGELPLTGLSPKHKDNIYLSDVYWDEELKVYRCAGSDGYVLSVCADSPNLNRAIDRIYQIADSIHIPGKQYRTDIGKRADRDREHVNRWVDRLTLP